MLGFGREPKGNNNEQSRFHAEFAHAEEEKVGRVAKTFGLGGELILTLFDSFPTDFNTSEPLFVTLDGLAVPLFCDRFERRGRSSALVIFSDLSSERRARELVGSTLWMPMLPAPEEEEDEQDGRIYLEDMEGWTLWIDGEKRGRIDRFVDGENPLFEVTIDERAMLIPAVEEFMVEIDAKSRTVHFDLPVGLLELYLQ